MWGCGSLEQEQVEGLAGGRFLQLVTWFLAGDVGEQEWGGTLGMMWPHFCIWTSPVGWKVGGSVGRWPGARGPWGLGTVL